MPDKFSKEVRSKIMSRIRSQHTTPELKLRDALRGLRFRYHPKGILGSPDLALKKYKIAVFVDGDFWHGYNWKVKGRIPPKGFWQKKIESNIARDKKYSRMLRKDGWLVIRFWEHQVDKRIGYCMKKVKSALEKCQM